MAPPPEYDKEPKAPDKSATTIANDDSKLLNSIVNDQQFNSDHKPSNTAANSEGEVSESNVFLNLIINRIFFILFNYLSNHV